MLDAEPIIIQRLAAAITVMSPAMSPAPRVCSSASIAGSLDVSAVCPLVVVHPARSENVDSRADDLLSETQVWWVVVVLKNVPNLTQFTTNFQEVSALLKTIARALDGWAPLSTANAMRYFARLDTKVDKGLSEFPLEFRMRYVLSTEPAAPTPNTLATVDVKTDIAPGVSGEPVAEDQITLPQ